MSIQKHEAISLFGAPNSRGLTVSKDLSDIGINMFRRSPMDVKIATVPDIQQPHYTMYKGLLPYFIHSFIKNVRVSTLQPGYETFVDTARLLPLPFPKLAISWSYNIADEIKDRVRNEFNGRDAAAGTRPIMLVPISNRATLVNLSELSPSEITPTVQESLNLQSYRQLFVVNNIITSFLLTHTYPAFSDLEHFRKFEVEWQAKQDIGVEEENMEEDLDHHLPIRIGNRDPISTQSMESREFTLKATRGIPTEDRAYITQVQDVPNTHGRFFAYVKELALGDKETIPRFMRRYMLSALGCTQQEIHDSYASIQRAWGNVEKTEAGNVLAHIVKVIEIAIEGQARAIPLFTEGSYRGTIISGTGWSASWDEEIVTAKPFETLVDAVNVGNPHNSALDAILASTGNNEQWVATARPRITSMNTLRRALRVAWTNAQLRSVVTQQGPRLSFGERPWPINVDTLTRAMSLIHESGTNQGFLDNTPDLPIHHSMLMEDDNISIIWSCFGGVAPSFKIPHGRLQKLDSSMTAEVPGRRGEEKKVVAISRVGVRNVLLPQAIVDLKWTINEKMIQNPFGQGQLRASQQHQDRFFEGVQGKQLIAKLREMVGIVIAQGSQGQKRKAEEGLDGASKRAKSNFGF